MGRRTAQVLVLVVVLTLGLPGRTDATERAPAQESALTGVTQLAAGDLHTCARLSNGQARCWGENDSGGIGDGTNSPRTRSTVVQNPAGTGPLTGVTQVTAGGEAS